MDLLAWNEGFSVGINSLDEQHKKMFEIINEFQEALAQGEGNLALPEIFKKMTDYTVYHFSSEEKILQEAAYPDYDKQKNEHTRFIQDLEKYEHDYEGRTFGLPKNIMGFLKGWWIFHIQQEDKKYTSYLQEKGYS